MRKTTFAQLIILLTIIGILSLTQRTYAASLYTAKEDGTITSIFQMNDKVRIIANSLSIPSEIIITDPKGVTRYRETIRTPDATYDKVLSGITDMPGWWKIEIQATGGIKPLGVPTSTGYLTSLDNVIPEVPLGTLSILITLFAAFGIYIFRNRSKSKLATHAKQLTSYT